MTCGESGNFGKVDIQNGPKFAAIEGYRARIASVFLLPALFGKQIDYLLSVVASQRFGIGRTDPCRPPFPVEEPLKTLV